MTALKPCPFCGEKMPPHDDTAWVRCYGCGAETGWRPTGDEAAAAWNTRADLHDATNAQLAKAVEALIDTTSHLVAALSLLEQGGKKAAPSDKMFDQMLRDYAASINRSRAVLLDIGKGTS